MEITYNSTGIRIQKRKGDEIVKGVYNGYSLNEAKKMFNIYYKNYTTGL